MALESPRVLLHKSKNLNNTIMKQIAVFLFLGILISFSQNIIGQDTGSSPAMNAKSTESSPIESITEAEMRDHIYFLASDYMGGRIATSSEYEIAAQYVATQFASGGVEPLLSEQENMKGYFQEVPFVKVTYSSECKWILNSKKDKTEFSHIMISKFLKAGIWTMEVWTSYLQVTGSVNRTTVGMILRISTSKEKW